MNKNQHEQGMDYIAIKRGYLPTIVDYYLQDAPNVSPRVIEYMEKQIKGTLEEFLDLQHGEKILDLGSGAGTFTVYLAKKYNVEVWALDVSSSWLEVLEKRARDNNVNINLVHSTAEVLPFSDEYFDKLVCSEVLEHIVDKKTALKEMQRVLKPNGILALSTPNKFNTGLYISFPNTIYNVFRGLYKLLYRNHSPAKAKVFDSPISPFELKRLAQSANFTILNFKYSIFGPDAFVYWGYFPINFQDLLLPIAKLAENIPFLNVFNAKLLCKARKNILEEE